MTAVDHPFEEQKHAYQVLGIPTDASAYAIKRAHRQLLMRWHPDHYATGSPEQREATKMAALITEAFEAIEDAPLRDQPPMANPPRRTEVTENAYAEEWKRARVRANKLMFGMACWPLCLLSAFLIKPLAKLLGEGWAMSIVWTIIFLSIMGFLVLRSIYTDFSCPRCHNNFFVARLGGGRPPDIQAEVVTTAVCRRSLTARV